jgi:hypothetical protein
VLCALTLTIPAAAAPSPAEQDTALAQVPAKAPLVLQLRGFERTRERLNVLIKNALPEFAAQAKAHMDEALTKALDGRELKGISKDGHIFLVFTELPSPGAPPKMAFLVPVTKYETFRDGLLKDDERKALKAAPAGYESTTISGEAVYFVNRKNGYAVVAADADVAVTFAGKYDGLAGKVSKPIARELLAADLSIYADTAAIKKEHGEAIKQLQQTLKQALEQSPDKNTAEQASRIFGPVFQGIADSKAVVASFDLRPEGVLLHVELDVAADSKTNTIFKQGKSLPLADLRKLPAGQMLYEGMVVTPEEVKGFGSLMLYGITPAGEDREDDAVRKAIDELAAAGPRQKLDAMTIPMSGLSVAKYDNPARAVAAQIKLYKALKAGSAYGSMLKENPVVKEGAQKHAGFDFNSVSLKWDLDKMFEKLGAALNEGQKKAMAEYMKAMLGEGMDLWFGTDGKTVLTVIARDWPAARALVDRYLKGEGTVGQTQPFQDAAKHLPANASLLMLINVPQYAEMIVKAVVSILRQSDLPIPIPEGFEKPAVKGQPSYLGIGLTLEPGRGGFDVWVAATSAHDVYKMYLERLFKQRDF